MPKTKRRPLRFFDIHYVVKFQKIEGGPFGVFKKFSKKLEILTISVPKNLKKGTLWDFLTFFLMQNIKQIEGRTIWGH